MKDVTDFDFSRTIKKADTEYSASVTYTDGESDTFSGDEALEAVQLICGAEFDRIRRLRVSRNADDTDHPKADASHKAKSKA
jgi:hypothetical protein